MGSGGGGEWTYRCQPHPDWIEATSVSRQYADDAWDAHQSDVAAPHVLHKILA
jgi:hypothetical protein